MAGQFVFVQSPSGRGVRRGDESVLDAGRPPERIGLGESAELRSCRERVGHTGAVPLGVSASTAASGWAADKPRPHKIRGKRLTCAKVAHSYRLEQPDLTR